MADDDPFSSDDLHEASSAVESMSEAMTAAVEDVIGAIDVDELVSRAASNVVAKHVSTLAKQALDAALTPERIALLQERTAAAVERAFNPSPSDSAAPCSDMEPATEEPELMYGSVDEWLREYWRFTYRRRVSGKGTGTGRWRAVWWNSDEALQRLTALWRSWEAARLDPGLGMSQWWINHADTQMAVLLSLEGPFAGSTDENDPGDALPYEQPPEDLFPSEKKTAAGQ